MRLRQLTWVNMTLPLLLGLLMASLLIWSFYQDQQRVQQIRSAQSIMLESFNLIILANDITLHPELRRAHQQWQVTRRKLGQLLSSIGPSARFRQLQHMQNELNNLDSYYQRMLTLDQRAPSALLPKQLQNSQAQIAIYSQKLAFEASRLMEIIRQQRVDARQRLDIMMIASLLLLSLVLSLVSIFNGRRVLRHLQRLTEATLQIGGGNLDYRIDDIEADELGDFSRALDAMTVNLQQVTARRDDLQREIVANQQAQARLQAYRDQLESLVSMRTHELEQSNRQLRQTQFAMERCGIGIHWVDVASARLLYVNDFACQLLGYERDEMLNMGIPDIDPNFSDDNFTERTQSLRERGATTFETLQRHKNGQLIPVEITLYYQVADGSDSDHFIGFITDIRQRKAAEQALQDAKKAAEAANRAKSIFLANMSHELRTPMIAILGFAQILERDSQIPEEQRRHIATISRAGNDLLTLINNVLEVSNIDTGRSTIACEPFELQATLAFVAKMIQIRAADKGLSFAIECSDKLPAFVVGDPQHLRQVLFNLLDNAIKYTEHGRVALSVAALPDQRISFEVTDTGSGISLEDQTRIFQAFYQINGSATRGKGPGLGLCLSQKFVRLMGGELTLQSAPGKGSHFRFTLPLPATATPPAASNAGQILGLAEGQTPPRILLAEDKVDIQEMLKHILDHVGCEVRIAGNGQLAVELVRNWQPQLILMDMHMPVMDGYEATRQIRSLPGCNKLPIVAMMDSAFFDEHTQILAAGCNDVLSRPLEINTLLQRLGQLLNLEYRYAEPAATSSADIDEPIGLSLDTLDPEIREQIRRAANLLDLDDCSRAIERLRPSHPQAATALTHWVQNFQFNKVLEALK